jgi:hypothetical protein
MAEIKAEAVSALGRRPDSEGRRRRRRRGEAAVKEDPIASWVPVTKLGNKIMLFLLFLACSMTERNLDSRLFRTFGQRGQNCKTRRNLLTLSTNQRASNY